MRHIQSIKMLRDILIEARMELSQAMMKDPESQIHWIDYTPEIFHRIDQGINECDTYKINKD